MVYRLKQARKMKGESLRDAAKALGMSHEGLNKYEQGKFKVDSKLLNKFAAYYEVTVDYFTPRKKEIELTNIQYHKIKFD